VRAGLPVYTRRAEKKPVQARAAGNVEAKCRRCDEAPTARRWRLKIAALVPRRCRACRYAGASALATLSRWRLGVVALVDVGIAAQRLGVAALTRHERAHGGGARCFLTAGCSSTRRAADRHADKRGPWVPALRENENPRIYLPHSCSVNRGRGTQEKTGFLKP
jgi:hypothetical protein